MIEKTFWISFDLGIRGDYSGLYTWLATIGARECGDSVAVFKKKVNGGNPTKSILSEIKRHAKLNKTDRIYIVYKEETSGLIKGKFLVGGRKRAPWTGYGPIAQGVSEDF